MEVGFVAEYVLILVAGQLTLGATMFLVILVLKLRAATAQSQCWRAVVVWVSLATLGLSLSFDALFLLRGPYSHVFSPELINLSVLLVGVAFLLALLGKGSGRALLATSAGLLVIFKISLIIS